MPSSKTVFALSSRSCVNSTALEGRSYHDGLIEPVDLTSFSECVALRIYQATAAAFIPLPDMEITFARNTNRSARWLSVAVIIHLLAARAPVPR